MLSWRRPCFFVDVLQAVTNKPFYLLAHTNSKMRLSTSEAKEDSKEVRVLSPSGSLIVYNKIVVNINLGQNKKEPEPQK
jgi:hypothetical protein